MNYSEYIAYHRRGDAAVEERMIASLAKYFNLSQWDTFKLIYFYSMTYHIPSALRLLFKPTNTQKKDLVFRTDRRYVRCNGAYDRLLKELNVSMLHSLQSCKTTEEAYNTVRKWFFFGRYTAFLFLKYIITASVLNGMTICVLSGKPTKTTQKVQYISSEQMTSTLSMLS